MAISGDVSHPSSSLLNKFPKASPDSHQMAVDPSVPNQLGFESSSHFKGKGIVGELDNFDSDKTVLADRETSFSHSADQLGTTLNSLSIPDMLHPEKIVPLPIGWYDSNETAVGKSSFSEASTSGKTYFRKRSYKPRRKQSGKKGKAKKVKKTNVVKLAKESRERERGGGLITKDGRGILVMSEKTSLVLSTPIKTPTITTRTISHSRTRIQFFIFTVSYETLYVERTSLSLTFLSLSRRRRRKKASFRFLRPEVFNSFRFLFSLLMGVN
ncbi:hypothetical protein ISN45_Aa01g007700 [Arabidopsis thaliana x Arabidopsis arenosa]|uniref:Uncharacterized protein n=1 Tax=Arabidopsis thaliana x Arabidopsis arenosa TaxID=1240361 RepID=A0A8T2C1E3_9BRAS|nr:hypothetical protein ISN45_Aa01g007700 [Arabidopsis thaliana x Arabidopsis arenosa]